MEEVRGWTQTGSFCLEVESEHNSQRRERFLSPLLPSNIRLCFSFGNILVLSVLTEALYMMTYNLRSVQCQTNNNKTFRSNSKTKEMI